MVVPVVGIVVEEIEDPGIRPGTPVAAPDERIARPIPYIVVAHTLFLAGVRCRGDGRGIFGKVAGDNTGYVALYIIEYPLVDVPVQIADALAIG